MLSINFVNWNSLYFKIKFLMAGYVYTPLKEKDRFERASHFGETNEKDIELLASKKYKELFDKGRTIFDPGYVRWLEDNGHAPISKESSYYSVDAMSGVYKYGEPDFSPVLRHKFGVDEMLHHMRDVMRKHPKLNVYEKGVPKTAISYYEHPFLNNLETLSRSTSSVPITRTLLWEETRGVNRMLRFDLTSLSSRWRKDFAGVMDDVREQRDPRLVVGKLNALGRSVAVDSFTHYAMGGALPDDITGSPKEWNEIARLRMRYSEPFYEGEIGSSFEEHCGEESGTTLQPCSS